jgi:hypothetical protein
MAVLMLSGCNSTPQQEADWCVSVATSKDQEHGTPHLYVITTDPAEGKQLIDKGWGRFATFPPFQVLYKSDPAPVGGTK